MKCRLWSTRCRPLAILCRGLPRLDRRLRFGYLLLSAAATGLVGCRGLTSVDAPDVRQPEDYATAAGASALAIGAITRFNSAFGGGTPNDGNQVTRSGLIADELFSTAITVGGGAREWDSRDPIAASSGAFYDRLHSARINLLTAIASMQRTGPDSSARVGQLFALVGYTEVFLGESFCAGVPLGRLDAEFRPLYGEPLTASEVYERAVADFDSALFFGRDSARIASLAAVGKGRALLNLGRFSEAGATVENVLTTYVYDATFVAGTLDNGLYGTGIQNFYTVSEQEGSNGLNWRTARDPRVPLINRSPALMGLDDVTDVWAFVPYQASNAPIHLASGVEARLIEAEAALQVGDAPMWLAIHNALRAAYPDTAISNRPLVDPGTAAGRVDLHFRERAFWLFLTGHRQGDLRRLVRQYGRDVETVFPTGTWRDGVAYGTATNIAPPGTASNDPTYVGCLDRDA